MMGYDYYYVGSSATGPVAPLYQFNGSGISVSYDINNFLNSINPNKFVLGMPYYGRTWATGSSICNLSMPTISSANDFGYSTYKNNSNGYFNTLIRDQQRLTLTFAIYMGALRGSKHI